MFYSFVGEFCNLILQKTTAKTTDINNHNQEYVLKVNHPITSRLYSYATTISIAKRISEVGPNLKTTRTK